MSNLNRLWAHWSILLAFVGGLGFSCGALAVDGVVLIDQSRALAGTVGPGDGPGFPVTITQSGSYRLASNLSGGGIDVRASDVSIDLNGFTISAPGAIGVFGAGGPNLTVRNGTIRNARIAVVALGNARIEHLFVTQTTEQALLLSESGSMVVSSNISQNHDGIVVFGGDCVIRDNVITLNTGMGIALPSNPNPPQTPGGGCTISGNTITANAVGIVAGSLDNVRDGSLITGNTVKRNVGLGLDLNSGFPSNLTSVGYSNNVLTGNNGGNQNPQVSGGIQMGTNVCGTGPCP